MDTAEQEQHQLYYRSGIFYLFTDHVDGAKLLGRIMEPHSDFPFEILPKSQRPQTSRRLNGTTWLLLCPQHQAGLIDHYFHFMEFLVGMWPVDQLQQLATGPIATGSRSITTVTNIILGPRLAYHQWQRPGQSHTNAILLKALYTTAALWDGDRPIASSAQAPSWISFDRVVIAERFATSQDALVQHANKMDMAVAKWAMQHQPSIWDDFKRRILGRLCPGGCSSLSSLDVPLQPVLQQTFDGGEYTACQQKLRLTYVSRQRNSRRLRNDVAQELERLLSTEWSHHFDTRIVFMQDLSPQEQIQIAANTDILLGIHGNGLTHGFWMPKGGVLVEMMVEGACLRDFQFFATIGGQRWVGINADGVMAPGNVGFCQFPGWSGLEVDNVVVDLRQLETVLLTVKNLKNRNLFE